MTQQGTAYLRGVFYKCVCYKFIGSFSNSNCTGFANDPRTSHISKKNTNLEVWVVQILVNTAGVPSEKKYLVSDKNYLGHQIMKVIIEAS